MSYRIFCILALLLTASLRAQSAWTVGRASVADQALIGATRIAYGNGRFVMAVYPQSNRGSYGLVSSSDGQTWGDFIPMSAPADTLLFLKGEFCLVTFFEVRRSTDGRAWTSIKSAVGGIHGTAATDGRILIVGTAANTTWTLHASSDLANWQTVAPLPNSTTGSLSAVSITYGVGRFFARYTVTTNGQTRGYVATTIDGTSWTPLPDPVVGMQHPLQGVSAIAGNSNRIVGIARGGSTTSLTTTDGLNFITTTLAPTVTASGGIVSTGGRFFALDTLMSTIDGITWTPLGTNTKPNGAQIRGMTYGKGRYFAVGISGGTADVLMSIAAEGPPTIAQSPAARTAVAGARTELRVVLENPDSSTTYQWYRNGQSLGAAATREVYVIASVTPGDVGAYHVEARNRFGTVSSSPAQLSLVAASEVGRIVNLSVLSSLEAPDATLTIGFVVGGEGAAGSKPLLVRAGGPSLARFGVARPLPDPHLELIGATGKIAENDHWAGTPQLESAGTAVGAFPFLSADSQDAALLATLPPGSATARVRAQGGVGGAVIAEIYDASPAAGLTATTSRLLNVSVLKPLPARSSLDAGFVIGGRTPKTILIRAVGPSLAAFGVASPLADPSLELYQTNVSRPMASNEDWSGTADILAAARAVGAFGIPNISKDAALLVTLEPGSYVAKASADNIGGSALVEIYEVPTSP